VSRTARSPTPAALGIPAVVAVLFLLLPLVGLVARAPWGHLGRALSGSGAGTALRLSLETASLATVVCLVLGIPLAWVLARSSWPGRRMLRALVTVPLVLPPVVAGVALLLAFGRHGLLGRWLDRTTGVTLPFTTAGAVVAEAFVALPFLVLAVEGALSTGDSRLEDVATTLGASPWYAFRRVTLPLLGPGVAAGAVLCWARALGEFGATITFAGDFPGTTRTVPLDVYLALQADPDAAAALSLVLLAVCLVVLVGLRTTWLPRR
jgi:molybdate transport system permease protein